MKRKKISRPLLYGEDSTFEQWLALMLLPDEKRKCQIQDYCFPSDRHRDEFLSSIGQRSETEIRSILRMFLITTGSLGHDSLVLRSMLADDRPIEQKLNESEFFRRLLRFKAWEGNTWVLDLLPMFPRLAIDAISAYIIAHFQFLPDGRWDGLEDCMEIIRARYLDVRHTSDALFGLSPREFEQLVGEYFKGEKYEVSLGSGSKDGGVDLVASRQTNLGREELLIQCKLYSEKVGVGAVRDLYGVVEARSATKGVVVTSSAFTADSEKFAAECRRIDLVDFNQLDTLFNGVFGPHWPAQLDVIVNRANRAKVTAQRIDSREADDASDIRNS